MTPADIARLQTWTPEIAEALLPLGTKCHDEGGERKYHDQGGLWVNLRSGLWFSHAAGKGGAALQLIAHLKQVHHADAIKWAAQWLSAHPGEGSCEATHQEDGPASSAIARDILDHLVDVTSTPGERYLESRRITAPFPDDCVRFLQHAPQTGECAVVGILRSHGRVVGVQVGFLDPDGRKTTLAIKRRRYNLERASDAVFEIPAPGDSTEVIVTEGLENALTIYRYGKRRCRVIGLPGIGALRHLKFPPGTRITVFQDSDPVDSPAAKELQVGIDHLMLSGAEVFVTPQVPDRCDANEVLSSHGVKQLALLLDRAEPATLSLSGKIQELAQLTDLEYERVRVEKAKSFGIRVGALDEEVRKARAASAAAAAASSEEWFDAEQEQPWPDPVDGAELLDDITVTIGRFVVMNEAQRHCIALWTLFTHCFDAAANAPKLWIKSVERRSGKTRLLELLGKLTARPIRADMISAAMIPRVIESRRPTLLMDEVDTYLRDNEPLRGVLNAGFDRDTKIIIGVKVGDDWEPKEFSPWCPQALAGIGDLPDTIADRSFKIELDRKPRGTKVARLRRRDLGPLTDLASKCARWAADHVRDLVDAEPRMPDGLNDRAADAWETCIAIADLADGRWPDIARKSALVISGDAALADDESTRILLIGDIRDIFERLNTKTRKKDQKLPSFDIVERLGSMEHRSWPEFKRGQPMTPAQLAGVLRPFHITPSNLKFDGDTVLRGYHRSQFERVWERYLPPLPDPEPPPSTTTPSPAYSYFSDLPATPLPSQDFCGSEPNSRVLPDGAGSTLKTAENTSVSANGSGVAGQNTKNDGVTENGAHNGAAPSFSRNSPATPLPSQDFCGSEQGFEALPEGFGSTLKNAENPSVSAIGSGVAGKTTKNERVGEKGAQTIADEARRIATENPDWTIQRIAKKIGQPESRIARYLPYHNRKLRAKTTAKTTATTTDHEVERIVEILRNAGPDGKTSHELFNGRSLSPLAAAKALDLGLVTYEEVENGGLRWRIS